MSTTHHPPAWLALFLMALGSLLTLYVDGSLGAPWSSLAGVAAFGGVLWYGLYRRRLHHDARGRGIAGLPNSVH